MASDPAVEASQGPSRSLHFTDLPRELQKEILSHATQPDLICMCLVSRHFRDLAAAELYRSFHIIFPDDDDPSFESPVDGLANGLETFATSDYDYAKHLREISLDTVSAGEKAELSYKPYLASQSCGKFMNTLLLLTLRRAKSLEKLRWNIRVELSRPVFKALHQIDTLTQLHIRLQAGPSIYEQPPPLPLYSAPSAPANLVSHAQLLHMNMHSDYTLQLAPAPFYIPPHISTLPPPPPPPKSSKSKASKKSATARNPPTLSGFHNLKSLSILDIDDLEVITELKSCIRNSQGSLSKLKLSFSASLALRARKPPPEIDPDDSDPDDDFQVVPVSAPPIPPYEDVSGPAKAFRAQEERKIQEAVLGRVFDVEPYHVKKPAKRAREKETVTPKQESSAKAPGNDFINSLKAVSNRLMKDLNGSEDWTTAQQDVLDIIEAAARKYVREEESKKEPSVKNEANGESSSAGANGQANGQTNGQTNGQAAAQSSATSDEQKSEGSLFEKKVPKGKENDQDSSNPDDIDIEAPVEDNSFEDTIEAVAAEMSNGSEAPTPKDTTTKVNGSGAKAAVVGSVPPAQESSAYAPTAAASLDAQHENFKMLAEKLQLYEIQAAELQKEVNSLVDPSAGADAMKRVNEAERQIQEFSENIKDIRREMMVVAAEIDDAEKQCPATARDEGPNAIQQRISEYSRSTRGLSLETLSIHLIPVKASVLSHAIDLRALQKITLLNVGNQASIWALLTKENKIEPLPLRKIFTDNVSVVFLNFVSQLPELHELYMIERPEKYKPESFAPRSTVTVDQIRRLALKKHIGTLKSLMIKNQQDLTWDIDARTTSLICRRGARLEELAISMSIREIHTLLRQIQLLKSMRALHIINLRNDDTCVWIMRETKRFVIDTLSHFPDLKLEWLAIDEDEHVERIIRFKAPPKEKKSKGKGKGKDKAPAPMFTNGDQYPVLSLDNPADVVSESEEDDMGGSEGTMKIETIENIHFYDVLGVRIFKRDVVTGRL